MTTYQNGTLVEWIQQYGLVPGIFIKDNTITLDKLDDLIKSSLLINQRRFTFVGDSLSAITNGVTPANQLANNFPGIQIDNYGVGGDNSTQIATRVGAIPVYLKVIGNQIPSSGFVNVEPQYAEPIQDGNQVTGNLYGIRGVFSRTGTTYKFTRLTTGDSLAIPSPQRYSMFMGDNLIRGSICIIEVGQNDVRDVKRTFVAGKPTGNPVVIENIKAIRRAVGNGRCIIVQVNGYNAGVLSDGTGDFGYDSLRYAPSTHVNPLSLDSLMLSEFKEDYVPIVNMMLLAGDGSANDTTDINNGRIPFSLRQGVFSANDVHLNSKGAAFKADVYTNIILSKGWLNGYSNPATADLLQNPGTLLRFNFKSAVNLPTNSGASVTNLGSKPAASVANNSGTLAFNNAEHAYQITADGDFLDFGNIALTNYIVCFKVKITQLDQGFKQFFGDHEGTGQLRIDGANDGAVRGFVFTSNGNNQGQGPTLTVNQWCHVGFWRYQNGYKMYLNGVLTNTYSTTGTNSTTTNNLRLGRDTRAFYQALYLEDLTLSSNNGESQINIHYNETI